MQLDKTVIRKCEHLDVRVILAMIYLDRPVRMRDILELIDDVPQQKVSYHVKKHEERGVLKYKLHDGARYYVLDPSFYDSELVNYVVEAVLPIRDKVLDYGSDSPKESWDISKYIFLSACNIIEHGRCELLPEKDGK